MNTYMKGFAESPGYLRAVIFFFHLLFDGCSSEKFALRESTHSSACFDSLNPPSPPPSQLTSTLDKSQLLLLLFHRVKQSSVFLLSSCVCLKKKNTKQKKARESIHGSPHPPPKNTEQNQYGSHCCHPLCKGAKPQKQHLQ